MKLKIIQNTTFKQTTEDSAKLPAQDKLPIAAGKVFEIHSWKLVNPTHLKVAFLKDKLGNPARNTWHVFASHMHLIDSQGRVVPLQETPSITSSLPETKTLNVPYKSQLDNALNPTGACNVTCFAMVMAYFQLLGNAQAAQLEDELYRFMENYGLSRHDPEDLVRMASHYRLRDDFTTRGKLSEARKSIAEGRPCIIHGYFTSFGHIIVLRGYNKYGFFVNDPYGEWTSSGYNNNASGENLHYSNALIQGKCSPEGDDFLWLHRLSRI